MIDAEQLRVGKVAAGACAEVGPPLVVAIGGCWGAGAWSTVTVPVQAAGSPPAPSPEPEPASSVMRQLAATLRSAAESPSASLGQALERLAEVGA